MFEQLITSAAKRPQRIVLAEGDDPRVVMAAVEAQVSGVAQPILIGNVAKITKMLAVAGLAAGNIEIIDPANYAALQTLADEYKALRRVRGKTIDNPTALTTVTDRIAFADMLVRRGDADGSIGGAQATTSDTVRSALQIIGPATEQGLVSSFFLMGLAGSNLMDEDSCAKFVFFADCGLVVEPTAEELTHIAIDTADSLQALLHVEPAVALLSFSTKGSAPHERALRTASVIDRVRARRPELLIDGELQFDSAFVPEVSRQKAPESPLRGRANVFVFPNLESGNIGYKIAQRVGGAMAVGPILQGLMKPANDLSRGCSSDDVYRLIVITALQAMISA